MSLAGIGFDSKCEFAPHTILLGLLLCPWMWGISLQLLQCLSSYWGFSELGRGGISSWPVQQSTAAAPDLGHGVSLHGCSSKAQALLLTLNVGYTLLAAHHSSATQPPLTIARSVGAQYATGDQWRNNSIKNVETEPKQKQHPVVDVTGGGSKVQSCKVQYCIGTWNVRSMNQGKLEVVK